VRNFFRRRAQRNELVPLAWQRILHLGRMRVLTTTLAMVYATVARGDVF
jgi:hypothetical protein